MYKKGTVITGALLAGLIVAEPAAHMLHPEEPKEHSEAIAKPIIFVLPPEHTHEDHPTRYTGEPLVTAVSSSSSFVSSAGIYDIFEL